MLMYWMIIYRIDKVIEYDLDEEDFLMNELLVRENDHEKY
jgi:hypothetical protein